MFTSSVLRNSRIQARGALRTVNVKRNFGGKTYREPSFKEAWCSDTGAYPVMGVIVFAVGFCSWYMTYVVSTHPDARLLKSKRKAVFRGDMRAIFGNEDLEEKLKAEWEKQAALIDADE
jgi:hypothetical protein